MHRFTPRVRFCAVLMVATIAPFTFASEVTVQNDSFASGQSAVIVGDFVAGEHAGVRLTSPCDGSIVAVQIGWLSNPDGGTTEFSIERNIWIYADGAFPNHGATLGQLVAPVLTPGFLNEFRYFDENNTQPINIPVTTGQKFYLTLEFDNPTDVLGGTASVFRDVSGCQAGKNVLFAIPGGWLNFCAYLAGDLVIRAIVDCGTITGACCKPDGSCAVLTQSACTAAGGTYQGDNVTCGSVSCPQPQGACCKPDGTCAIMTQAACTGLGGSYGGNNTPCAGQNCKGACCFESTGNCLNLSQNSCAGAHGIFHGIGTTCGTTVCFPTGACCLPDGSCLDGVDTADCSAQGGTYQGDFTACGSVSCPPPVGACCFSDNFCIELTESDCQSVAATWKGVGSSCADGNGDGTADDCISAACVPCDTNCDGSTNPFDIQSFLSILSNGGGCSPCAGDANNDGTANPFDINAFMQCMGG